MSVSPWLYLYSLVTWYYLPAIILASPVKGLLVHSCPQKCQCRKVKMDPSTLLRVFIIVETLVLGGFQLGLVNGLSMNYYLMSCPILEPVVKNTVSQALRSDPTLAAGLVRMHFHDCFIQGCDASVLIDSTEENVAEKDSPGNLSLRGYEVIDSIKEQLERLCPGVVSCADILAMAARDAVFFAGGPLYEISKGRRDGRRSKIEDTIGLPFPTFNSSELIQAFGKHGFSVQDMVALSGAHTLGVARCSSFKNRLSNFDATNDVDPTADSNFVRTMSKTCEAGDNAAQPFDRTWNTFDNNYFQTLQRRSGLLTSDQTLYTSLRTRGIVDAYAANTAMFFMDFQRAMVKMGLLDVNEGPNGEIRTNCRRIN